MATGDSNDFLGRLKGLIPPRWFAFVAPVRDAVFGGLADALTGSYSLLSAMRLQTRISTATGWFLDLISYDFFGLDLLRFKSEADDDYRRRIKSEIFRQRVTLAGISEAVEDLTGTAPQIFIPSDPGMCGGGYGVGHQGYGESGAYGSISYPNQIFLTVTRPANVGVIPNIGGYGVGGWGYGAPTGEYASLSEVRGLINDSDIYATIANNTAAGVVAWTNLIK